MQSEVARACITRDMIIYCAETIQSIDLECKAIDGYLICIIEI